MHLKTGSVAEGMRANLDELGLFAGRWQPLFLEELLEVLDLELVELSSSRHGCDTCAATSDLRAGKNPASRATSSFSSLAFAAK